MNDMKKFELGDDELDAVVGGYEAGQKVNIVLNPRDVMSYEPGEEEAEA